MTTRPGSGAVSGPGALSQRTDKTPVAAGGAYGARKAAEAQQAGAPMAGGGAGPGGSGAPAPQGAGPMGGGGGIPSPSDVFGPTGRPGEPATAGLDQQSMYSEADPYLLVRLAYQIYPHPSLARLLPEE